jgi:hypothetical protein
MKTGGDPQETADTKQLLGFVDGQTTNPTLIAKNPHIKQLLASGHKLSERERQEEYKKLCSKSLLSWEMPAFPSFSRIVQPPTFTYLQNFDCVDQPTMDLDFNHVLAQSDPNEMQTPICQAVTEPTEDPTGGDIKHTAHLYVFIPFFSVDGDTNPADAMPCPDGGRPTELCGTALGTKLIALFGFLPEAWKATVHPAITTQCPDPNHHVPGTCTMHASSVDLSETLVALGKIPGPPTAPVFVPTPNHSHVVDNSRVNSLPIWWEVRPVLILHQSDWPAADGSSGITSSKAMDDAEAAGRAIEVGSNFFLFFSSQQSTHAAHLASPNSEKAGSKAHRASRDSLQSNRTATTTTIAAMK